ncbi:MAG: hypothetical protein CMG00_03595 [Candidatus Marinimicrobia bacterium]|nr:hypothetical protein [Candidatus Neomarinimicrobiota bacterium]|tara:strand:- start:1091 stop:1834 length:744 start_codon:yes stop_codon:yes gene_type:complete
MFKNRIITIFLFFISLCLADKTSFDLLNTIIQKYDSNVSFRLTIKDNDIKTIIDVDRIRFNDSDVVEKSRLHFIEPLDFSGVYSWIWFYADGKTQKWITKPGTNKVIDITNNRVGFNFDFSMIQINPSILNYEHVVSDTVIHNNLEYIIVDIFKKNRGRKKSKATMKVWIDANKKNIHKIYNFGHRKGKLINEIIFDNYIGDWPRIVNINNIKNKKNIVVQISNLDFSVLHKDSSIFNPIYKNISTD